MHRRLHALSSRLRRITSRDVPRVPLEVLESVLIRQSRDSDRDALECLAALDSRRLCEGAFLLAEVDGELVAAAPLDAEEEPSSDPFRPTATLREFLRLRAKQIRSSREVLARRRELGPRALGEAA
jgi:hypothetical protein